MKNVLREVILGFPFHFPPLAERHHVVAKIDELMAMCEQAEANLAETVQPVDAREVQAAG
jgi:type I restriction enzyme S subunit